MKNNFFYLIFLIMSFIIHTGMKTNVEDKFIQFDDNLFVSKFELTNDEYRQFIKELQKNGQTKRLEMIRPDSSMWSKKFEASSNVPYTKLYHRHPAYNHYPVVNITKEAIIEYCEWITKKYNSNPKRKYDKVIFRLPSEKEWKKFFSPLPGHKLPWYGNLPYNIDKKNEIIPLANIKVKNYALDEFDYLFDESLITGAIGSYKENSLGLYDIIGNAAELTSQGKIKGGSWYNTLDECLIDKTQNSKLPDPRVGFRLVMEIIKK